MGKYQLGKDGDGNPLTEDLFYIHIQTGDVIQLLRDAAGFRVEYGPGRRHANIFDLNKGPEYMLMAQEDFEREIRNSERRKFWLERGLAVISQSTAEKPTAQQTPDRNEARDDYIPERHCPQGGAVRGMD